VVIYVYTNCKRRRKREKLLRRIRVCPKRVAKFDSSSVGDFVCNSIAIIITINVKQNSITFNNTTHRRIHQFDCNGPERENEDENERSVEIVLASK
jgi:hypothetical protein